MRAGPLILRDRAPDHALLRLGRIRDNSPVELANLSRLERLSEEVIRRRPKGKHQQAAGFTVEAMEQAKVSLRSQILEFLAILGEKPIEKRVVLVPLAGLGDEACGLFDDDDIVLPLVFDDYFLFSLCQHVHYRMPTDFEADSAIVIRDPELFKQRLISTFLAKFPDWTPMEGNVTYYDPYRDYTKFRVPEMAKHFGYAYQKETRIVFRAPKRLSKPLEPVNLNIGSMRDYADLVTV